MAKIQRTGAYLDIVLTPLEKLAALHRDIRVPLSSVTAVTVIERPLDEVKGFRAPGLHIPSRIKIGTWRASGRRTFAVARARQTAVRIDLGDGRYDTLIVSIAGAAAVAEDIRTAPAER